MTYSMYTISCLHRHSALNQSGRFALYTRTSCFEVSVSYQPQSPWISWLILQRCDSGIICNSMMRLNVRPRSRDLKKMALSLREWFREVKGHGFIYRFYIFLPLCTVLVGGSTEAKRSHAPALHRPQHVPRNLSPP
jgi:hypothetical protein